MICFKGKAIGCVWHKSEGKYTKFPKILACAQAHEDLHVTQLGAGQPCKCRPNEIFVPEYKAGELNDEECAAYTAQEECMKKAMLEDCNAAYDPSKDYSADGISDCEFAYGWGIESTIKYKNYYCGKSADKKAVTP